MSTTDDEDPADSGPPVDTSPPAPAFGTVVVLNSSAECIVFVEICDLSDNICDIGRTSSDDTSVPCGFGYGETYDREKEIGEYRVGVWGTAYGYPCAFATLKVEEATTTTWTVYGLYDCGVGPP